MRSVTHRILAAALGISGALTPATLERAQPSGTGAPPLITSAGYRAGQLVPPNPLNEDNGLALDGRGGVYVCQALYNRISHLDLTTGAVTMIADEHDARPLQVPDDVAIGRDGDLYITEILGAKVTRMSPDGSRRAVVGYLGDGTSLPNGIAFNAQGRLFATDLAFADPSHPGGLWELDPSGVRPASPIVRPLPTPNGFAFGPDGKAYIPEMFAGRIDVVDVDARTVHALVGGFGYLVALKVDPAGRLVVMETDTGRVWRVDRTSGARTLLAQGQPGLDNLVITPGGTIYVTNFVHGNVWRVNESRHTLEPLLPDRSLGMPMSLSESPDGSLLVGDLTAVSRVRAGRIERLSRLLEDQLQMLTPSAVQVGSDLYISDFFPPDGRIERVDLTDGRRERVAGGFGYPWTLREGPAGRLLVVDEAAGVVDELDPHTGLRTPVVTALHSPSGLAVDRARGIAYVSDTGAGRVLEVELATRMSRVVAGGLTGPEGVAIDRDGSLLVVEGDAGRLVRLAPDGSGRSVVAEGLPTRTRGVGLPLLHYSSDVLVRRDGGIVVSGDADGSLIELTRSGAA